jgi:hypothetical protein
LRPPLDASLVPPLEVGNGNSGVLIIRVGELFAAPELAAVAAEVNAVLAIDLKRMGLPLNLPVRVQDVEQAAGRIMLTVEDGPAPNRGLRATLTAVRMSKAFDWTRVVKAQLPAAREVKYGGAMYYETDWQPPAPIPPGPFPIYVADERTIVVEGGDTARRLIDARTKPPARPAWADEWKEVEGGLVAVVLEDREHRYAARLAKAALPSDASAAQKQHARLEEQFARCVSRVVAGLDVRDGLRASARFTCDRPADAEELEQACKVLLKEVRALAEGIPDPAGVAAADEKASILFKRELVASVVIRRDGRQVIVTAHAKQAGAEALRLLLTPAEDKAAPLPPVYPPRPPLRGSPPLGESSPR